jgi:hypothetical protein
VAFRIGTRRPGRSASQACRLSFKWTPPKSRRSRSVRAVPARRVCYVLPGAPQLEEHSSSTLTGTALLLTPHIHAETSLPIWDCFPFFAVLAFCCWRGTLALSGDCNGHGLDAFGQGFAARNEARPTSLGYSRQGGSGRGVSESRRDASIGRRPLNRKRVSRRGRRRERQVWQAAL